MSKEAKTKPPPEDKRRTLFDERPVAGSDTEKVGRWFPWPGTDIEGAECRLRPASNADHRKAMGERLNRWTRRGEEAPRLCRLAATYETFPRHVWVGMRGVPLAQPGEARELEQEAEFVIFKGKGAVSVKQPVKVRVDADGMAVDDYENRLALLRVFGLPLADDMQVDAGRAANFGADDEQVRGN